MQQARAGLCISWWKARVRGWSASSARSCGRATRLAVRASGRGSGGEEALALSQMLAAPGGPSLHERDPLVPRIDGIPCQSRTNIDADRLRVTSIATSGQ